LFAQAASKRILLGMGKNKRVKNINGNLILDFVNYNCNKWIGTFLKFGGNQGNLMFWIIRIIKIRLINLVFLYCIMYSIYAVIIFY
jgi:hypothetical protein